MDDTLYAAASAIAKFIEAAEKNQQANTETEPSDNK